MWSVDRGKKSRCESFWGREVTGKGPKRQEEDDILDCFWSKSEEYLHTGN